MQQSSRTALCSFCWIVFYIINLLTALVLRTMGFATGPATLRLFWFLIHALGLDLMVQEHGCVFIEDFGKLALASAYKLPSWREHLSEVVGLCQGVSPIKFKQFHLYVALLQCVCVCVYMFVRACVCVCVCVHVCECVW